MRLKGKNSRSLSFSEVQTVLTCEARHAFGYTGRLTNGHTLKRRQLAPILSDGRAWGAGVAAWHAYPSETSLLDSWQEQEARMTAHEALRASYAADIVEQYELGFHVEPAHEVERLERLSAMLDHYISTAKRLPNLTRLEGEFDVAIPARTGRRASTRYRFTGRLDGFTVSDYEWLWECKLRGQFHPTKLIQLSRQIRDYAWAYQRETGRRVVGVIVDERLNEVPKPARIVKAKRKGEGIDGLVPSHDVSQMTTVKDYVAVCQEFDVEPQPQVLEALGAREWQRSTPIIFRPGELEEAGRELVSAAQLIRDLDSGARYPIRNAQPQLCKQCSFLEACPNPEDEMYLETLYQFTEPKRLRERSTEEIA